MKQVLIATALVALSALALAGPAHADDQSYLDYLNTHGFTPGSPADWMPDAQVRTGHSWCDKLRSGFPEADLRAGVSPRYGVMIDAAQHELCPDTLSAPEPTFAQTSQADEQRYLDYLNTHGFTPGAPVDWMPDIQVRTGHSWCGMLRSGFPEADLRAGVSPRYGVMIDAAQHELCPDTLS